MKKLEPMAIAVFGLVMLGFGLMGLRWGMAVYYSGRVNTRKLDYEGERVWVEKREEMIKKLEKSKWEQRGVEP